MNERNFAIEPASPQSLPELVRLFNAYRDFYGETPAPERALAYLEDRIANSPGRYFLAWERPGPGRRALGFMHLIPSTNTLAMRPIWFLEDLYVEPAERRRGVAAGLLQHAEAFARGSGAERLTLATAHDNLSAQRLYARMGYLREDHFWYFHRLLG